jgi:AraC-like DNA-binding protein/quercetin dioxygenase-like cupin family protein
LLKDQTLPAADKDAAQIDGKEFHADRIGWLERSPAQVVALASDLTGYPRGHSIPSHRHGRSQLLYALSGVLTVATSEGRWMMPPEHALWIPAGVAHSVEMIGAVEMRSLYVAPDAIAGLPARCRVVGITGLMRSLIVEAVALPSDYAPESHNGARHERFSYVSLPSDYAAGSRAALLTALILQEIPRLPEKLLGLPFPTDPRLAELCRRFVAAPSPRARIDDWADALAMSRRTFTRAFRNETGVSLSTWRQQCCLFTALPRLSRGESVTSVAFDLGYDSVAAFTTMFKRMLGVPPRFYFREASQKKR